MSNDKAARHYRSGFVSIIGRPNVGKSTLLNRVLGERIAITTHKPQTTRNRILGVKHFEGGQIVYLDTPGVHRAKAGLNRYMLETALGAIGDADLVYLMLEASPNFMDKPDLGEGNRLIIDRIDKAGKPVFLVINKVDLVKKEKLLPFVDRVSGFHTFKEVFMISAENGDGVEELVERSFESMPEGPPYFPEDQITDRTMRFLASEIIREKALLHLEKEVPYSVGVEIELFRELDEGERFHIEAVIYVERESQKGIVIGKGGIKLKAIGAEARADMESFFKKATGLKLFVKVRKDWTLNPRALSELGYKK